MSYSKAGGQTQLCDTPGIFGGIGAQYLHCDQEGAAFPHIEGELKVGKVLRVLDFTQVHLSRHKYNHC